MEAFCAVWKFHDNIRMFGSVIYVSVYIEVIVLISAAVNMKGGQLMHL